MSGDGISMVRRLRMAFALGVGLVVLVGLAGAGALALASERVGHLTDELTPAVEANGRVLQAMLDAQTGLRGYQLTGDPAFLEPHERGLPEVGVQIEKVLTSTDDPAVAELMAAQQRSAQA
ncbi:MAG TPA: CHASE3 domain-containing protein, partial [Actinomycetales bacterium]|nr:CHASE3 domain-containing protein [Actinomycetales bacterium]